MSSVSNTKKYSNTIYEPITENGIITYDAVFDGLYDIYQYLKSNPNINEKVFTSPRTKQNLTEFYGTAYDEALENLIKEDTQNEKLFATLTSAYTQARLGLGETYETKYSLSGGHLNNLLYVISAPKCYEIEERIVIPKYIDAHINFMIPSICTDLQIYNRAIIVLNILNALEKNGYVISLDAFTKIKAKNEIIRIFISLKNFKESININDLGKILFDKSFYRRIIFRIMETLDVKEKEWQLYYGVPIYDELNNKDLNFTNPMTMGIEGNDLYSDFLNTLDYLNLKELIDIEDIKYNFKEISLNLKK